MPKEKKIEKAPEVAEELIEEEIIKTSEKMTKKIKKNESKIQEENKIVENSSEVNLKKPKKSKKEEALENPKREEEYIVISPQAEKWKKWLQLHGSTPERFLEKYPNHPAYKFVKELVKD